MGGLACTTVQIEILGETVELMAERCVFWPSRRTLLVADLHLGKPETFLSQAIALPTALSEEPLTRLAGAVARSGAQRVLILGDLLHASIGTTPAMVERVRAWRSGIEAELEVVTGNHDGSIARVAGEWGLRVLGERRQEGPFVFQHEPGETPGRLTWCGHIHPMARVGGRADGVRRACCWIRPRLGVLPAFTRFSTGASIAAEIGDRVFVMDPEGVLELPIPPRRAR